VVANANNIEQVFTNLIDNAIKYTPDDGDVVITASVQTQHQRQWVQIAIKDTGIGIEAKHIPRLFERFYRVDKARSRDIGGTGLGLSIVKHIIQYHGGDIWVDSTPNEGTCFYFTLPVAP
jgi:two-component system, OmpR family, phosphate regulon sensor histidine kinase PhoR